MAFRRKLSKLPRLKTILPTMANGNCNFYLLGNCISKEDGTGIRLSIDMTLAFIAYNFNSPESLKTAPSNNGYFLFK